MKPQQSVFNMLAKATAKQATSVKVNFAIADDLKKATIALEKGNDSIYGSFEKSVEKINAVLSDSKFKIATAIDAYEVALAKYEELHAPVVKQMANFEKAAKELGMSPDDSPVHKEAFRVAQDFDSYIKGAKQDLATLDAFYSTLKEKL